MREICEWCSFDSTRAEFASSFWLLHARLARLASKWIAVDKPTSRYKSSQSTQNAVYGSLRTARRAYIRSYEHNVPQVHGMAAVKTPSAPILGKMVRAQPVTKIPADPGKW